MAPKQKTYANIYYLAYAKDFLEKMLILKLTALESIPLAPTARKHNDKQVGVFRYPF